MADQILPEGIRFFPKNANAPDFVICTQAITMNKLFEFCKKHPELVTDYQGEKQIKLQILKSKDGKMYAKVDNWKPEPKSDQGASEPVEDPGLPF